MFIGILMNIRTEVIDHSFDHREVQKDFFFYVFNVFVNDKTF